MSQIVVAISDMAISNNKEDTLVTYSLGSCLGVTVYDPVLFLGGLIHCLLPLSSASKVNPPPNPNMFVNSGVTNLIRTMIRQGAKKERLVIKAAGGAHMMGMNALFNIGERNFASLEKLMATNNMRLAAFEVGGTIPRTCSLLMSSGQTFVRTFGEEREI